MSVYMKRYSFAVALTCLLLCVGITALAMVTSYYGWPFRLETLSHFQAQYFMSAIALTLITLCLRRSRFTLAAIFLCAILSAQLLSWYSIRLPSDFGSVSDQPATYKVISANLWVRNTDATRTLDFIQKEQPDLAILMEVNEAMDRQLEALKTILPYSSNQLTSYRLGTVLYSKTPLTDVQLQKFDTRSATNMTAHVDMAGNAVSVVAIHPFPPVKPDMFADRNRAFAAVSEYVKKQSESVILAGDFNTTMWSPYYRQLVQKSELKNSRDGFGILPTWPSRLSYLRLPQLDALTKLVQIPIDHCLASPSLRVMNMHTGPHLGSDHLPIVVDFELNEITADG